MVCQLSRAGAGCCVDLPGAVRRAILALPRTPHLEGKRLFSSEQLFDEVGSSADVLRHAPFLERARVERDHDREVSARLALAAYVTARLMDRLHEGEADDESREAFAWQVEAVRRHLSNLPPELPETAHLVGILEAVTSSGQIPTGLRLGLTAYAYFLEHEARLAEALDVLALAARCHDKAIAPGEFAAIALFAARLRRLQAQWAPAIASYTAAEEAGHAAGDMVTVLRSRLGRCGVLRGQGNLPASRALAESVLRSAEDSVFAMSRRWPGRISGSCWCCRGISPIRSRPSIGPSAWPRTRSSACDIWATWARAWPRSARMWRPARPSRS